MSKTVLHTSKSKVGLTTDGPSDSPAPGTKDVRLLSKAREKEKLSSDRSKPTSRISSKDKLANSNKQNGATNSRSSLKLKELTAKKTTISEGKLRRDKTEEKKGKDVVTQHREKGGSTSVEKKRGTSSIYLPKTSRSTGSVSTKTCGPITAKASLGATKDRQKIGRTDSTEKTGKTVRRSSRERRKSRTLSPSEVKILHSALKRGNEKQHDVAPKQESEDYDYEDDFEVLRELSTRYFPIHSKYYFTSQDYESDFQDCTDSEASQVSEERETSDSPEPEPIEMQREEQVIRFNRFYTIF